MLHRVTYLPDVHVNGWRVISKKLKIIASCDTDCISIKCLKNVSVRRWITICFHSLMGDGNIFKKFSTYPANIYLFKVNNRHIRKSYKTCSNLMSMTSSRIFIANFEHISHLFPVFLLLILNKYIISWVTSLIL